MKNIESSENSMVINHKKQGKCSFLTTAFVPIVAPVMVDQKKKKEVVRATSGERVSKRAKPRPLPPLQLA